MSQEVLQVIFKAVPEKMILRHPEGSWPNIKDAVDEEETEVIPDKKGRRKSWHAIKFEKKRKKDVIEDQFGSPPQVRREKRGSWWNIFSNPPRSRRASQDITKLPKDIPIARSKSRSVDHGITSPYDLALLRSTVDKSLNRDLDGSTSSLSGRRSGPPENTTTYTVVDRDTLTSVAARFDTTPSELTKLNRLATPYIFPGQQLYVPLRESVKEDSEGSTPVEDVHDDLPPEEKELLDNLRPVSPKPGHVERVRTPSVNQTSVSIEHEEEPASSSVFRERFLKINVRHITDGEGVVSGVLLVTPNAVMFDPNVSDPLVIEKGPEAYGVIAPMEFVVNIAIYNDIAHMRVSHMETSVTEKAEIYYPKGEKEPESLLVKDETFPELVTGTDDAESVCSCTEREGDAFPKAFDRDLVTPTNLEEPEQEQRTLEERRKSLLDHHWPMTSRERQSIDTDELPAISTSVQEDHIAEEEGADHKELEDELPHQEEAATKESCHDSGIDIREAPIVPIPVKEHYSDADIVLSKDWVPPVTLAPSHYHHQHSLTTEMSEAGSPARKKTNSVSFSLDSSSEADTSTGQFSSSLLDSKEESEKSDNRKNKMLKRLSVPLSWMETLSGEKEEEKLPSQPQIADTQHSSVFSKVFSSSPMNLVDFGTGLFTKTPSEDSGGSGGPHSGGSGGPPLTGESAASASSTSSFFPTNIISSVGAMGAQVGAQVGALGSTVGSTVGAVGAQVGAQVGALGSTVGSTVSAVGRSSVGTFIRQPTEGGSKKTKDPPPKLDYRSMVSVEDKPELFASFDKLIPRPARSCEDPPLYLRLKMGKPMNKKIPHSTPLMSYGKKKMRPEYWFSIPKNRVDELYKFVHGWVPHLYGELDEEKIRERNFILVDLDTELWSEEPTPSSSRHGSQGEEIAELTKESWEVLPMSEEYRRAFYSSAADTPSLDIELSPPDLIGKTEILTDEHRESLCRHLPARAEGYAWTLVFSTSQHGFSLNSMYRKMYKLESPILLVIQDTDNNVFGALTSCALHVSDHFYGTGESLLFRFTPHFQVYNWTGENLYFIKGNNESLSIGAGDGKFGLWLDGDLYLGRTETCKTYGNDPLTPKVDFVVKTLECWAFISS
ncbi:oxidation resistance protein 1 isoform X13 [Anthonomus grandis grandis]|uniref:oxidation resistance protein 1 isoform X13 n=1 Tax=Anthonomus grandis grandis TaxID=2921223 RepID=UPI0021652B4B|nr:oxidation resistance protein 1 isoform X13 [Anthonomus grandis grandis]